MQENITYQSLEEINKRKDAIRKELELSGNKIHGLWNEIFHSPKKSGYRTPSQKFLSMMGTGAGVLDGALLGWKLYRRFKK